MLQRITPWTACFCLSFAVNTLSAQDPKTVKVEAPTRIDWKFVASAFGERGKVPDDYDSKEQTYQLFVPKDYDKEKSWPLVVFISPTPGPDGWRAWKKVCTEEGILFCSPFKAGNDCPAGKRTRIVLDMFDDVRRHYNIDPDQTYLGGESGGGRMSCTIGFRLPEYFGGLIPVCGINPPPGQAYLRHRMQDRLSVAFVTGATDFNRRENEVYMHPLFQDISIRTKLWIPNVGHSLPPPATVVEVMAWLKEDLKRRQQYRLDYPGLSVTSENGPTPKEQAAGLLQAAQADLKKPGRQWQAMAMLQALKTRYSKQEPAIESAELLTKISRDENLLKMASDQKAEDEIRFLSSFAKASEKFNRTNQAIELWQRLVNDYADTPAGKKAMSEIQRLQDK